MQRINDYHLAEQQVSETQTRPRERLSPDQDGHRGPQASSTTGFGTGDSNLSTRDSQQLGVDICALAERLRAGTYELLVLVGEFDARGAYMLRGALSAAAWLANACDIEVSTARSQVRVARAMREFPTLDAAMRSGDVSYAKARVLVPYLDEHNSGELVELATRTPAGKLGAVIAVRSMKHDDQETITQRQREARSVTWRTEPDGTVTLTAKLTPTAAAALCAVIDIQVTRETAPAGASLAQQRADALVDAVTRGDSHVDAEVVVHVTPEGNTLTDGTPIADHTVTSMIPDAFISLLVHDNERQPIDASPRRRFPTRRQRRVIDTLCPQCAHQGCGSRSFLQYDHIIPYAHGGPTTIDNLQRLCGPHNRDKNVQQPRAA